MKLYAVVENNKVINIVVEPDAKELAKNPDKYIEYTNRWDFDNGIDGSLFFIKPDPIQPDDESST